MVDLLFVRADDRACCFHFHNDAVIDDEISAEGADDDTLEHDFVSNLPSHPPRELSQSYGQCIRIHVLRKAQPELILHFVECRDDVTGDFVVKQLALVVHGVLPPFSDLFRCCLTLSHLLFHNANMIAVFSTARAIEIPQ